MKLICCSVYDSAAGAFGRPFFVPAVGIAIRSFREEVNRSGDPMNAMFSNPQDFELHKLGEFDDSDGTFTCPKSDNGRDTTVVVARAFDLKEPA